MKWKALGLCTRFLNAFITEGKMNSYRICHWEIISHLILMHFLDLEEEEKEEKEKYLF